MTFKAQFLQDFAADRLHHSWKGGYVNNNPNISHGILHSNLFFFKSNMAYHVITDLFKYPNQPSNISISLYTSSPKSSCPPVMSYLCANPKDSISTSSATSPHQIPMVLKTHWVWSVFLMLLVYQILWKSQAFLSGKKNWKTWHFLIQRCLDHNLWSLNHFFHSRFNVVPVTPSQPNPIPLPKKHRGQSSKRAWKAIFPCDRTCIHEAQCFCHHLGRYVLSDAALTNAEAKSWITLWWFVSSEAKMEYTVDGRHSG